MLSSIGVAVRTSAVATTMTTTTACMRAGAGARRAHVVARRTLSTAHVDNPYTGERYPYAVLSPDEVSAALDTAAVAQREWAARPLADRVGVLLRAIELFSDDDVRERAARETSEQMGKPLAQARGEIGGMCERIQHFVDVAPRVLADEVLPAAAALRRKIAREPVGVVLCIAPWNYPYLTAINTVAPALLAGNAVLLKHSPRTPAAGTTLVDVLARAGLPAGVAQSVQCEHSTVADTLIADARVAFVAFTGSVRGGREVHAEVARRSPVFADTTLELGGKDAGYVRADADPHAAAELLVDGSFYNAGQSCCGIERAFVHADVYDEFMAHAARTIAQYRLGNPLDAATTLGPLALQAGVDTLVAQCDDARARGARVLLGGEALSDTSGHGRFFAPTLLGECTSDMAVMRDESFGPLLACARVTSDDEAIERINDCRYGLTAAIVTRDTAAAERLGKRLDVGTVFVNRCDYLDPQLPWSGTKETGKGVSLSRYGFDGVTRLKGYNIKSVDGEK